MRTAVAAVAAALLLTACLPDVEETGALPPAATPPTSATAPVATPTTSPGRSDLRTAIHGDGDSWRDPEGRTYRLGMINAPEVGECYGSQATDERKRLTADGFRAHEYAQDRYGRGVSVVHAADGTNINVHLARHGFADDRYLADFRHENPSLAAQLDAAFAAAKREGLGLWRACAGSSVQGLAAAPGPTEEPPAPAAAAVSGDRCHPDYATCIPRKGDGSGRGAANDLDCDEIGHAVVLRVAGTDPYRLDADGDGTGCDS